MAGRKSLKQEKIFLQKRIYFFFGVVSLCLGLIVVKLFNLQITNGAFFKEISNHQHDISQKLIPERGRIFLQDPYTKRLYPLAINYQLALVYADPRLIKNPLKLSQELEKILTPFWQKQWQEAQKENSQSNFSEKNTLTQKEKAAEAFLNKEAAALKWQDFLQQKKDSLLKKLRQANLAYVVIARRVPDDYLKKILALKEPGIGYIRQDFRYYPEGDILSDVSGFVGLDKFGHQKGRYGLEGYYNDILKGKPGELFSEKDALGRLVLSGQSKIKFAQNGADLILTINRAIQFKVCQELRKTVKAEKATRGMVVILNPQTDAVIAMCVVPSYNANYYYREKNFELFNNPIIFDQYEPGSVFKSITMAAGLDTGKVTPDTKYFDKGCVKVDKYTICNSDRKSYKIQTMTNVLEKSLNTGAIFVANKLGLKTFRKYVKKFGFGALTGIDLKTESLGDINILNLPGKIYMDTASFGQGIAVTPIQMVNAYAAIANGGVLKRPYVVKEIIFPDGKKISIKPKVIRRVISRRADYLLKGMLASVIERGHGRLAGVKGYYVAGKTGTAQVPKKNGPGYVKGKVIGSFIGFAPVDHPRFVMLVRIDDPQVHRWGATCAAPLFHRLAKFMFAYYQIKPKY